MQDETALLKAENERLHKIIAALIEYNEVLKGKNALLHTDEGQKHDTNDLLRKKVGNKIDTNTIAEIKDGISIVANRLTSVKDGINIVVSCLAENNIGNSNVSNDQADTKDGICNDFPDQVRTGEALRKVLGDIVKTEQALQHVLGAIVQAQDAVPIDSGSPVDTRQVLQHDTGGMVDTHTAPPNDFATMPHPLPVDNRIIWQLGDQLRASGYKKVSDSGVDNAAKLLIHLYNGGGGSYPELRKVTGHSTDGVAKFVRSMKNRGWIYRSSYQRFALSNPALELIQAAWKKINGQK